MIRKICLLLIGITVIAGCSKQMDEVVAWKPEQARDGDKVTIFFKPQRLIKSGQEDLKIFMVYQLIQDQTIKTSRIPMTPKKQYWRASIKTEPGTYLVRLKFEDEIDRVEDNNGFGWNIKIRNSDGNTVKNTHYTMGVIFSQELGTGYIPEYDQACSAFNQELLLFPDNFKVWYDLWSLKLNKFNWSNQQIDRVKFQLDSLLTNSKSNVDLIALAHNTYWKLLKDQKSAIQYGELILSKYENHPIKEEIEYSMIFMMYGENKEAIKKELIQFNNHAQTTTLLKNAYYQLGLAFQKNQELNEAIKYFQKYIELAPDDLEIRLNLANLFMRSQNYELAQQMIDQARFNNTEHIYFQLHPWEDPQQRRNQLNLNQCQILSTQATLETALKKYQLAIHNRKQVVKLGTLFPAYEWTKIGDLYFQSGKLDSAQKAYVKAVSINTAQEDAIQKLHFLYHIKNKTTVGFNAYLQGEIYKELRSAAKSAPDFDLIDIDGGLYRLSEQKGNVVVLTFWDSWSSACQKEIPQLNTLVNEFKDNPLVAFWAISVEAPISINKFITSKPFHYHLFHSGYEVKKLFNVIGFPTHVVIDPSGKIRYTHVGYSENIQHQLKKDIESILKEDRIIS